MTTSLAKSDPTVYPVHGDMGSNSVEIFVREILRPLVEQYLHDQGTPMFVGSDQYIYWEQYNATRSVGPDLYVIPGLPPQADVECIQTWTGPNLVPVFALEVVSKDKGKDYLRSPARYAELGVKELVVYDPQWKKRRGGLRWQLFRRVGKRGLVRVEVTNEDRVFSKQLGCWLREVRTPLGGRLRLAVGPEGESLVPTEAEQAQHIARLAQMEAERARAEAERAQAEAERAQADAERARSAEEAERAGRQHAEAELARLRAELRALQTQKGKRRG